MSSTPKQLAAGSLLEQLKSVGFISNSAHQQKCKICGSGADLFGVVDFNRSVRPNNYPLGVSGVPVYYHKCKACEFVFTTAFDMFVTEAWPRYIYNDEYFKHLDPGYKISRPTLNVEMVKLACDMFGKGKVLGVDYGGGNGVLAHMLTDRGVTYYTHDPFAASTVKMEDRGKFNFLSCFEVLEHTTEPLATFSHMLEFLDSRFVAIVSTQCHDGLLDECQRLSWTYIAPRHGHVSIYSGKTMRLLAQKYLIDYMAVSRGTHIFGRGVNLRKFQWAVAWVKAHQKLRRALGLVS